MKEHKLGLLSTALCYTFWGILPLYWHMLDSVNSFVILANRIVWSLVFTTALLLALRRSSDVGKVLRDWKKMRFMLPAALTITINWGLYIWSVNAGHLLDASLGYYLNPLIAFAFGMLLFHEKCGALEWVALGLAVVGVLIATIAYGAFPWIAVGLATSFAVYGMLKKYAGVSGITSIAVETVLIAPFAIAFLIFSPLSAAVVSALTLKTGILLFLTGVVTATPMILFTRGVNSLPLTTVGFLQYISPTLQLLIGTLFFHEALTNERIVALVFFGVALVLYSIGMARRAKEPIAPAAGE